MSKISIAGATTGTGTFTLASPATNTDRVLTLPDEAGTVLTTAGVPASAMPAGSVLQVVQAYRTSMLTTTSSTPVDVLTASITPSSTNSRILIMASGLEATYAGDGNTYSRHLLKRDATSIYVGDASGSALGGSSGRFGRQSNSASDQVVMNYVDSPSSTSSITYKWQFYSHRGPSWTVSIGGSARNSYAGDTRSPSSLILMEIAG